MRNLRILLSSAVIAACFLWTQAGAAFVLSSGESLQGEIVRSNSDTLVILDNDGQETSVSMSDLDAATRDRVDAWKASNPDLAEVYQRFDEQPVPVSTVEPSSRLIPRGARGIVSVAIVINADGDVVQARIHRSQNDDLNEAALDAVNRWSFEPARVGGAPVACFIRVPLRFN